MPFGESSAQPRNLVFFRWLVTDLNWDSTPHVAPKVWLTSLSQIIFKLGRGEGDEDLRLEDGEEEGNPSAHEDSSTSEVTSVYSDRHKGGG